MLGTSKRLMEFLQSLSRANLKQGWPDKGWELEISFEVVLLAVSNDLTWLLIAYFCFPLFPFENFFNKGLESCCS